MVASSLKVGGLGSSRLHSMPLFTALRIRPKKEDLGREEGKKKQNPKSNS